MTHMHIYLLQVCLLLPGHEECALAGQYVQLPPRSQPSGIEDNLEDIKDEVAKLVEEAKKDATGAKWSAPSLVIPILSVLIAGAAWVSSWRVTRHLVASEKKRFVVEIRDRIDGLAFIDWDEPDPLHVREAINALGLIASFWRNDMLDKTMAARMFGELFQRQVNEFNTHREVLIEQYHKTVAELLEGELRGLKQVAEEICKYTNR